MSMASRLEAQSAADKKRWTAEREEWDRSREEQERRIARLEKEKEAARRMASMHHSPPFETEVSGFTTQVKSMSPIPASNAVEGRRNSSRPTTPSPVAPTTHAGDTSASAADDLSQDDIVRSESLELLRAEIVRLRKAYHAMEVALQDLKNDGYRIEQVMQKLGNLGRGVVTKADSASRYLRRRKSAGENLTIAPAPEGSRGDDSVKTNEES